MQTPTSNKKRKASSVGSSRSRSRGRAGSRKSSLSRNPFKSSRSRSRSSRGGGSVIQPAQIVKKVRYGKVLKSKRRKLPKVSKLFKEKVEKSLEGKRPRGIFIESKFGLIETDYTAVTKGYVGPCGVTGMLDQGFVYEGQTQQYVFSRLNEASYPFDVFCFRQIYDAVGVLFYNKIARMGIKGLTANHRLRDEGFETISYDDGSLSDIHKLVSAKAVYILKNNSRRKMTIQKYVCHPKKMMGRVNGTALEHWYDAMAGEIYTGTTTVGADRNSRNIAGGNVVGTLLTTNQQGATPNTLGAYPGMCKGWTALWKHDYEVIELQAGQETTITLNGPKNVEFIPLKWKGEKDLEVVDTPDYMDYKPGFSQSMFFVIAPDILPDGNASNTTAGRYVDNPVGSENDSDFGLAIQRTMHYKFEAAPGVGGQLNMRMQEDGITPGTVYDKGQYFTNTNAKDVYYINSWQGASPNTPQRIDPTQPATIITAIV